ncbi:Metallophosphoesterase 1 [Aphelenchoides besseyi]|nr:Metallophosphoesterase 1 [Aphelenchoides besseyi]
MVALISKIRNVWILRFLDFPRFLTLSIFLIFLFNEYLIYYLAIVRCGWKSNDQTKIMVIADTHLLGVQKGHWFDKLRREYQMYRSFQTASYLLRPDAVFFLGDLFDEGQWGDDNQFERYVDRFNSLFYVNEKVKRYTVVGNHDIGFHYAIMPRNVDRFNRHFGHNPGIERVELNGNHFILINSMAMEGDYCRLCAGAVKEIDRIADIFNCSINRDSSCKQKLDTPYSRPILMQHFPLHRKSDLECMETDDLAPPMVREEKFRERWECLSEKSTQLLIEKFRPRAAFGGHVHYGCQKWWTSGGFWEYTVASFSWRNNRRPSFLLLTLSPQEMHVDRCFLPNEHTVYFIYAIGLIICSTGLLFYCIKGKRFNRQKPERLIY